MTIRRNISDRLARATALALFSFIHGMAFGLVFGAMGLFFYGMYRLGQWIGGFM